MRQRRKNRYQGLLVLILGLMTGVAMRAADDETGKANEPFKWDFESDPVGGLPTGWKARSGSPKEAYQVKTQKKDCTRQRALHASVHPLGPAAFARTTSGQSRASEKPTGAPMKIAAVRRTLAILALAATQVASSQLPPLSPPVAAPPVRPEHDAAPATKKGEMLPEAEPSTTSESQSKDSARFAAKRTQTLAPTALGPPDDTPAAAGGPDRFRLKADVDLVLVEATVRDQYGGIPDNLTREDFHLYEDDVEQRISHFSRDELPLAVVLVLDRSGSMDPVLKQLRRVAYDTLSLLKPDDQVALFDFAARAEQLEELTTDRQRIADRIATIHTGGGTVIADALFESALYLDHAVPNRRHAIILVSDNENTLKGYSNESRVIRQALEAEAVIYSIRVEEGLHPQMMNVLLPIFCDVSVPMIARETGGEVIDAKSIKSVRSAMATAITRLKQRYSLGYYTTNHRHDGAFRQIEIRVANGSNESKRKYTVYARRGYYARAERAASLDTQP